MRDCVLGDNEEERSFPEDLKQEELPQVRETQSPERGPACDVSPHEQRDFRKFTLDADGETLHCEEKPFKCPECGKGFKGHCRLLTHLQIHTREKVFVCAECGKSFGRKANLVVHQRVHTGERPYKCKECEKTFSRASSLLAHHKTHLKKKIFSCTMCRKNFSGNTALLQHQRVHTEEKPCRHSERGNSFSVSSNFIRYQHLRERPSEHTAVKKMRENMDMLLLNQRSQLQVLQEIQKQLNILLPGNALLNSNDSCYDSRQLLQHPFLALFVIPAVSSPVKVPVPCPFHLSLELCLHLSSQLKTLWLLQLAQQCAVNMSSVNICDSSQPFCHSRQDSDIGWNEEL
ncbi:hypothetical protein EK904_012239 [Melospiza melodia maxima]|nr:hypothetical protein EK904_012239 [Melospiza melodia maxima]